tara:strand:+ start:19640 stop:20077 length:438 start_codon:yes stop_codon:yes gene_type:complete
MNGYRTKAPILFWIITTLLLLWNLMGVLSFFMHTFISDEALAMLAENERELYASYPAWTSVVFAIAVFCGLFGSLGLLIRKKWSKIVFIISLSAIIPQMIQNVFFTNSIDVYGFQQAATMPTVVVVVGIFVIWFSSYAIRKNWLS